MVRYGSLAYSMVKFVYVSDADGNCGIANIANNMNDRMCIVRYKIMPHMKSYITWFI